MKYFAMFTVLLAGVVTSVASPCWDGPNDCGSAPACQIGEPGVGSTQQPCAHQYCDNAISCSWSSSYQEYAKSTRTLYSWQVGNVQHNCVSSATYSDTGSCCICTLPGWLYTDGSGGGN